MRRKPTELAKKFGMKIRIERVKLGMSQEKLAEAANLTRNTVSALERGENSPTLETIAVFAKAFNLDLPKMLEFNF
ncbi:MAG: helix-turn-helix domain-containing protein [Heliobacteriaceae bacterium]|jgi:putative transcriptional regulator|nr:helix-turn-helix domain-containing protein [Heliobacteriaceae bacterium]